MAVRRRRRRDDAPSLGELQDVSTGAVREAQAELSGIPSRLAAVERNSGMTLPTDVTMTLANSSLTPKSLRKAARMLAKQFDVEPSWLLGAPVQPQGPQRQEHTGATYTDPVTGGPLTLDTARRVIKPFAPEVIRNLLKSVQEPAGVQGPIMGPPAPATPQLKLYVTDPDLLATVEAAVAMWNQAVGMEVVRIVTNSGVKGAVPVSVDQRGAKFADAEFTEGAIVGNKQALHDPVTLAHEIGHALGLPHAGEGSQPGQFVPWKQKRGGGVPSVGLMGTDEGQRAKGPTRGEVEWLRERFTTEGPGIGADPLKVAAVMMALAPLPGKGSFTRAFGVAAMLAEEGVNPALLRANIEATNAWVATTKRDDIFTSDRILNLAAAATLDGVQIRGGADLVGYIVPELKAGVIEQREQEEQSQFEAGRDPGFERQLDQPIFPKTLAGQVPSLLMNDLAALSSLAFAKKYPELDTGNKDFFAQAEAIGERIKLDESVWERSFLNRFVVHPVLDVLGGMWATAEAMAGDQLNGFVPGEDINTQAIAERRTTIVDEMNEKWGVPKWVGITAEFIGGWFADPLVLMGRAAMVGRIARVAPELLEGRGVGLLRSFLETRTGGLGRRLAEARATREGANAILYRGAIEDFTTKYAERFTEAALSPDENALIRQLRRFRTNYEERTAFDHAYFERVRKELRARFPAGGPEAVEEMRTAIGAHFAGGVAPRDSIAARAIQSRTAMTEESARRFLDDSLAGRLPDTAPAKADQFIARGTDAADEVTFVARRLEVPTQLRPIPGQGISRLTARNLVERTPLRGLRKVLGINPGQVLKMHDEAGRWFELRAVRWGRFGDDEIQTFRRQAETAGGTYSVARENALISLQERMDREAVILIARDMGVPDEVAANIADELIVGVRRLNEPVYGARTVGEGTFTGPQVVPIRRPLTRTELVNEYATLDPVTVTKALQRHVGTARRMRASWNRLLGRVPPEAAERLRFHFPDVMREFSKNTSKGLLGFWKLGVVARPAYIFRVILGDELLRSFATTQALMERILAQEFKGRVFGGGFLGRPAGGRLGDFLDDAVMHDRIEFPNGAVYDVPRPGAYAREIYADPMVSQRYLIDDIINAASRRERQMQATGKWGIVQATSPQHLRSWEHALSNKIARSPAGQEALSSVAKGRTQAGVANDLRKFAKTREGKAELASIGVQKAQVDEWADELALQVHTYSMGNQHLAQLSLTHDDDLAEYLGTIPKEMRPAVHGPLMDRLVGAGAQGPFRKFAERWYGAWVRQPENILNRQPFYKIWKGRASKTYAKMLADQGVDLTPEVRLMIDEAAKDFSLAQGKAIMFDFTENTRLGEMLGFVAPFTQPFVENIAVWGHIIMHRNPALLGYTRVLWRAGERSGFIEKDEETGETQVPLTWWAFGLPMLAMSKVFGGEGWRLLAPLSNLNLFVSNTFRIPSGVPLAGGLELPVPSLAPWVQTPLQRFFADTTNTSIQHWLFQFGSGGEGAKEFVLDSLLPSWLNNTLKAVAPEMFEDAINASSTDFLRLQQYLGQEPNAERARTQAQQMAGFRALMSLIFPTQPMVEFPYAEVEQEWHDLTTRLPFDEARDFFLDKYPDYSLITIGKTFWGRKLGGLNAPRVPASKTAAAILNTPGFKEFAHRFPEWAAGIILSDQHSQEFDFNAFAAQLAAGDIHYKTPERVLLEDDERKFWQDIDRTYNAYTSEEDLMRDKGFYGTQRWDEMQDEKYLALYEIYQHHPSVAKKYMTLRTDADGNPTGAQFDAPEGTGRPFTLVMRDVDALLDNEVFMDFPAGKGLEAYMKGREEIVTMMENAGVRSLRDASADEEGIVKAYGEMVAGITGTVPKWIKELHPDIEAPAEPGFKEFGQFYSAFFDGIDLRSVQTSGDKALDGLFKNDRAAYNAFKGFDSQLNSLMDKAADASPVDRPGLYQRARDWVDHNWRELGPKTVKLWFTKKTNGEREQYMNGLYLRPPEFYSRLDWALVGQPLSNKGADLMRQLQTGQALISRVRQEDPNAKLGDMYGQVDAFVREAVKQDKSFASAVDAMNDLGWGLEQAGLTKGNSKPAWAWRQVMDLVRFAQGQFDRMGINGTDNDVEWDEDNRRIYDGVRDYVEGKIDEYRRWSAAFDAQWLDWQDNNQGELIKYLLPDVYIKLGVGLE